MAIRLKLLRLWLLLWQLLLHVILWYLFEILQVLLVHILFLNRLILLALINFHLRKLWTFPEILGLLIYSLTWQIHSKSHWFILWVLSCTLRGQSYTTLLIHHSWELRRVRSYTTLLIHHSWELRRIRSYTTLLIHHSLELRRVRSNTTLLIHHSLEWRFKS